MNYLKDTVNTPKTQMHQDKLQATNHRLCSCLALTQALRDLIASICPFTPGIRMHLEWPPHIDEHVHYCCLQRPEIWVGGPSMWPRTHSHTHFKKTVTIGPPRNVIWVIGSQCVVNAPRARSHLYVEAVHLWLNRPGCLLMPGTNRTSGYTIKQRTWMWCLKAGRL